MSSLVIVESPAKCGKIEKLLGPGYKCVASYGHIRELSNLSQIDIENDFAPTFRISDSKKQQVNNIRRLIKDAKEVILAADDDREGEAIAWHICDTFNLPINKTKRIIFHEITETALKNAVKNTTYLDMNKVKAQQARQILDIIVGFKISPILWNKISYKTKSSLSAGRCQTPALKLVYDNQKDIDNSPGKKVYNTTGYFTSLNLPFILNFNHENEDTMSTFLEDCPDFSHIFTLGKDRDVSKNPPTPFTTSTLQQTSSNNFRYSPKKTMEISQRLYEAGLITYMRTDSTTYSKDFIETAKEAIKNKYGNEHIHIDIDRHSERRVTSPKKKNLKKGTKEPESTAQEAHEAIRPTDISVEDIRDLDIGEFDKKLYSLIWKNTIESCMAPASYKGVTASITAPDKYLYKFSTEQVVFPGWKIVGGYEKVSHEYAFIHNVKNNFEMKFNKIISKVSIKDLKSRFSEAKLVQQLEKKGIGRPSTFSSLIDKIQVREYVKIMDVPGKEISCIDFELEDYNLTENINKRTFGGEKNKLVIQPVGILVIEFLVEHFDNIFSYDYTSHMEAQLDEIAKGRYIWYNLCKSCLDEIDKLSHNLVGSIDDKIKIIIDDKHTYMIAKYGPVIKFTDGDKTTFYPVKENIDIDKLKRNEYKLKELIQEKISSGRILGTHKDNDIILKKGKFGAYIEYGLNKKSVSIDKTFDDIEFSDIEHLLSQNTNSGVIRKIDEQSSIRSGQYGDYIFYKKSGWKKPRFLKLGPFIKEHGPNSYKECAIRLIQDFIHTEYNL